MAITADEVRALISEAEDRGESEVMRAQAELSNASALLISTYNAELEPVDDNITDPSPLATFTPATPPTLVQQIIDTSGAPSSSPTLDPLPTFAGLGQVPVFQETAPIFLAPVKPSEIRAFNENPPEIVLDAVFPEPSPALDVPVAVPGLSEFNAPTRPELLLPAFDGVRPTNSAVAPTDLAGQFIASYREQAPLAYQALQGQMDSWLQRINPEFPAQMARLEARIAAGVEGGTGISADVEDALYERARDRIAAEGRRNERAAWNEAARRGHTTPPASLLANTRRARQDAADNMARAANEQVIEAARMEQQNAQFALTTSLNLRQTVLSASIQYHGNLIQINGQALQAAQFVVQQLVQVYNITADAYRTALEGYKADAAIFETKLRGVQAAIDLYRADLAAEEAKVNVDQVKVGLYRAQLEALQTMANIYRTRVETVVSKAQLEKLKIDVFGVRVQAYQAEVQGNASAWQAYVAAIRGEEARIGIYTEQVRAHGLELEGFKTVLAAKEAEIRAVSASNEGKVRLYEAQYRGYAEKMRAEGIRVSAATDFQRELIQTYGIANQAQIAAAQAASENFRVVNSIALQRGQIKNTQIIEQARIKLSAADGISRNAVSAAQVHGNLASAALSGINSLVSASSTTS